tara:strand:+ start:54138 stop:55592 length:1455 start_codon:yes stop_codon:yes gene_type:complete
MTNLTGSNLGDGSAVGRQTEHLDDVSQSRDLPEGWVDTQLGQIVDYGKAAKKTLEDVEPETWILELEDIEKDSSKLLSKVNASERPFKSTKNAFKKGDVLYGKLRPYLNKVIIAESDGVCTTEIIPIDSEPFCLNCYLFYWLKSSKFLHYVDEVSYGVNMPRLGTKDANAAPFRLAPLAEQKVIADKLDELLAQVESTKARLDAIPAILKSFRQSLLAAAVSGKLTEEWRGENGVDLSSWKTVKVGDFVQAIEAGKSLKCIETPPSQNEFGIIKISAVTWGIYDESESKTLPSKDLFIENRRVKVGDLLISRANTMELLGNPVIVHNVTKNLMLSDKVLRLVMDDVDKPWVSIFLRSKSGRKEIEGRSTGNQMSMRNIGQKALLDIGLPKATQSEQAEIVRRAEALFAFADKVEAQVNAAQKRVNNLTQSILAKAFRGELTADWRAANPELISGENSAEALLKRIKAEREALSVKKKPAKKAKA